MMLLDSLLISESMPLNDLTDQFYTKIKEERLEGFKPEVLDWISHLH